MTTTTRRESERSLILQDAYHYALRALNESDGTFADMSRTRALLAAYRNAKRAGVPLSHRPARLSDAKPLFEMICSFAASHGIDASLGCHITSEATS